MALVKISTINQIEVTANGTIQVQRKDSIMENGDELSFSYHRHCLCPDADLTNEDAKVVAIANAVWTPEVIAAYQEQVAAC